MTIRMHCPTCGPIYSCDRCADDIIPASERVEGKIVTGNSTARSPLVWGVWCSVHCLTVAISEASNTDTETK